MDGLKAMLQARTCQTCLSTWSTQNVRFASLLIKLTLKEAERRRAKVEKVLLKQLPMHQKIAVL